MKKIHLLFALFFAILSYSQIPTGYYNSATGSGYVLKTQLYNIIKGHNDLGYGGLWSTYNTSDRDGYYEQDNSILDLYSENPLGQDSYIFSYSTNQCGSYSSEGGCYNREHLVPQSYFGNQATPMYSDAHFVIPVDGKVNGWRDDHPFGIVSGVTNPCNAGATNTPCNTLNGSKLGNNIDTGYSTGYNQKVFEPLDEFKGDIARCLLYFATRYETQLVGFFQSSTSEAKVMFDGSYQQTFSPTFLNILLTWNQFDPVSTREIDRNNAIYNRQNNRNPYIDNNSFVTSIWGLPLSTNSFNSITNVSIFPNPTNNHSVTIASEIVIDDIQLITINGQLIQEIKKPVSVNATYTLENLPQGFYFLKLSSNNNSVTKKISVN